MKLTLNHLASYATVVQSLTGLRLREFERLLDDVLPLYAAADAQRLKRGDRQRAPGGGDKPDLALTEQLLLTVIWLRKYPTRDTMRLPAPGRKRRLALDALLADTPALAVIVDTFEQRVQRPKQRSQADGYYSGKKKQHTLKSQIAVDDQSGLIVDVATSVPGPTHDMTVLKGSGLLARLPDGVGALGDLAYNGLAGLLPAGLGASPRRKPNGKPRPAEDVTYNRAFARRRITVEHTIGRLRHYEVLRQMDRQHRQGHTARVIAVAGLVNRQIKARLPHC